jgi:predicted glycoside hydrolase/deacetylase ChbG (UPF0249 family)
VLIINADDWGRSPNETELAAECFSRGRITSATGMVFMEDSERAAQLARAAKLPVGLHLNLSEPFTAQNVPPALAHSHRQVARFLKAGRYRLLLYNPCLRKAFRDVYEAQANEFQRLYGSSPTHIDGHQHLHLCANVLLGNVIPRRQKVRKNLSFWPGERTIFNRTLRKLSDRILRFRYCSTDYFFCLSNVLQDGGFERMAGLARNALVELMVHPARAHEHSWLLSERYQKAFHGIQKGTYANF